MALGMGMEMGIRMKMEMGIGMGIRMVMEMVMGMELKWAGSYAMYASKGTEKYLHIHVNSGPFRIQTTCAATHSMSSTTKTNRLQFLHE